MNFLKRWKPHDDLPRSSCGVSVMADGLASISLSSAGRVRNGDWDPYVPVPVLSVAVLNVILEAILLNNFLSWWSVEHLRPEPRPFIFKSRYLVISWVGTSDLLCRCDHQRPLKEAHHRRGPQEVIRLDPTHLLLCSCPEPSNRPRGVIGAAAARQCQLTTPRQPGGRRYFE